MSWMSAFRDAVKHEQKPMHQCTYWMLFLACGFTYIVGVVSGAASASYALVLENPEIASSSWLATNFF